MKKRWASMAFCVGVAASLSAASCDPEKAALDVFADQGLTLLRPARDYVAVGGLVVQPKSGQPGYRDPLKTSLQQAKPLDFTGIIMQRAKGNTADVSAAVSGLGTVLPLPVGFSVGQSQQVSLSQINTSGVRMGDNELEAYVAAPEVVSRARNSLAQGSRLFVIQEIYRGAAMSLTSTTNSHVNATIGGKDVPQCAAPPAKKESASDKTADAAGETKPTDAAKKPAGNTPVGEKTAEKPKADAGSAAAKPSEVAAKAAQAAVPSISASVCRGGNFSLSFKTDTAIPFAVRLAELIERDKQIVLREGSFKFPKSLGNSKREKTTVMADGGALQGLVRLEK